MSRWIDADALLKEWCEDWCLPKPNCEEDCAIYDAITQAPSIDIVRCRECRLGGTEDCPMDEIDDEYFCNFGEREGE